MRKLAELMLLAIVTVQFTGCMSHDYIGPDRGCLVEIGEDIEVTTDQSIQIIEKEPGIDYAEKPEVELHIEEPIKPIAGNTEVIHNVVYPELFPEFVNLATLTQDVAGLTKGMTVDVLKDDGRGNYKIKPTTVGCAEVFDVKSYHLRFPSQPRRLKTEITDEQIEEHINGTQLDSDTDWLVWTSIARQETYVFKKHEGMWDLQQRFLSSTGKTRTPTPKGLYKLTKRVPSFGQNKGYMCKNAFGFIGGNYLYHSLVYDITGSYLLSGKGVLGTMASDGCIRFTPDEAKWFYDNLEVGSTVWIN